MIFEHLGLARQTI